VCLPEKFVSSSITQFGKNIKKKLLPSMATALGFKEGLYYLVFQKNYKE